MAGGSAYNGLDPRSASIHSDSGTGQSVDSDGLVAPIVPGHTSGSNPGAH